MTNEQPKQPKHPKHLPGVRARLAFHSLLVNVARGDEVSYEKINLIIDAAVETVVAAVMARMLEREVTTKAGPAPAASSSDEVPALPDELKAEMLALCMLVEDFNDDDDCVVGDRLWSTIVEKAKEMRTKLGEV